MSEYNKSVTNENNRYRLQLSVLKTLRGETEATLSTKHKKILTDLYNSLVKNLEVINCPTDV